MEKTPFLWLFWKLFAIQIIWFILHWKSSITGKWIKFFAVYKNQQFLTEGVCFRFDCHSIIILLLSCFHDLCLFCFHDLSHCWVNKIKQNFQCNIYTKKKKSSHAQNCVSRVLSFAVHSHKSSVLRVLTFVSIIFCGSQYCFI